MYGETFYGRHTAQHQLQFAHWFRDNAVSGDIPLLSPVLESMVPP